MGGDDLGSDDEYLNTPVFDHESDHLESLDKVTSETESLKDASASKRKREDENEIENDDEVVTKKSSTRILVEAGRDIEDETTEVQAKFLWTALTHHLQMKGESIETLQRVEPHNFAKSDKDNSLLDRLKGAISMKKLKNWRNIGSPMIIVVCISARRAVAVLKELSGLKVKAAKLFAKHMNVSQQRMQLQGGPFGLAVGTPNRLKQLCEGDDAALNFSQTKLFVLDSHVNQKGFTVSTLPDTAPDCMLLLQHILPQLKKRKDMKLAIF